MKKIIRPLAPSIDLINHKSFAVAPNIFFTRISLKFFIIFALLIPVNAFSETVVCGQVSCASFNMYPSPNSSACGVNCEDPNCVSNTEYKKFTFSCDNGSELKCCCCGCTLPTPTPTPSPTPTATATPLVTATPTPASVVLAK